MGVLFLLLLPLAHAILLVRMPSKENNLLFRGGYENEEKILDHDSYRRAAESSAGNDGVCGGGRWTIAENASARMP